MQQNEFYGECLQTRKLNTPMDFYIHEFDEVKFQGRRICQHELQDVGTAQERCSEDDEFSEEYEIFKWIRSQIKVVLFSTRLNPKTRMEIGVLSNKIQGLSCLKFIILYYNFHILLLKGVFINNCIYVDTGEEKWHMLSDFEIFFQ